jgi:dTMP kinase
VRRIVLSPETGDLSHRTEALLFAADKAEHVDTVVLPALERGAVVITDRYVDTSLAYQGTARDLEFADVELLNRWATGDVRPHLTVVLDVHPELGLGRFAERDRLEGESADFHERARQAFLDIAAADPDHYLVLDARGDVEEIARAVRERIAPLLGQAARR